MKRWYQSKTMWFNLAIVGGAALDSAVGLLPTVESLIRADVYSIVFFVTGVVNMVLRAVTVNGIGKDDSK
jgi:hypothetical protein